MSKQGRGTESEKRRIDHWILGLHFLVIIILGLSLFPMVFLLYSVWKGMAVYPAWLKILAFSCSISVGYFIFGTTLIFLCVAAKNILGFRVQAGLYSMYSKEAVVWMGYNSLILLANAAFLDVFRLSPFQTLFYRLMGAKVGNNVNINTGGLADLALLTIGDRAVIGGGVALIGHAVDRGFLRLAPTIIGNDVSIGLGSVILPGCEIGDGAAIAPCTLLPKGTKVPPRGHWGGNPARDLREERRLRNSS